MILWPSLVHAKSPVESIDSDAHRRGVQPLEAELQRRKNQLGKGRDGKIQVVVALLGLLEQLDGEVSDENLEQWLNRLSRDSRLHPLVSSYARLLLGHFWEVRGQIDQSRQIYDELGYLREWNIIAPFDNVSNQGHRVAYGPEKIPFAADQVFPSRVVKTRISWSKYSVDRRSRNAWVSLDDAITPNSNVVGYATTWVRASLDQNVQVILHIGTGGPYKVWCNDRQVGQGNFSRSPHPLQDGWSTELQAGWNRLLIKVSTDSGQWGFFARLSDLHGNSLKSLELRSNQQDEVRGSQRTTLGKNRPGGVRYLLEQALATESSNTTDKKALLEFYRYVRPVDLNKNNEVVDIALELDRQLNLDWTAKLLFDLDAISNKTRQRLVRIIKQATESRNPNESRLVEFSARFELFNHYQLQGLGWLAKRQFDQLQQRYPDNPDVRLLAAISQIENGWPNFGLSQLNVLAMEYPLSLKVQHAYGQQLIENGQPRDGIAVLEGLVSRFPLNEALNAELLEQWLSIGEIEQAQRLAQRWIDIFPKMPNAYRWLIQAQAASGMLFEQIATTQKLVELLPFDPELHRESGKLLALVHSRDASIAAYDRSLKLKSDQPQLRDLLQEFRSDDYGDLVDVYAKNFESISTATNRGYTRWKGHSAVFLVHRFASRAIEPRWSEQFEQRIIHILNRKGAIQQALQSILYDPSTDYVELRRARVRRRNGELENIENPRIYSVVDGGDRAYYSQRRVDVEFPALQIGDTLEVVFRRRRTNTLHDGIFADLQLIGAPIPKDDFSYLLETNDGNRFHANYPTQISKLKSDDRYLLRFVRKDVAATASVPNPPGLAEIADVLHISATQSWDNVANGYWLLVQSQMILDQAIHDEVQQTMLRLSPKSSEHDKIKALYSVVNEKIRYIGLEFGVHGYKPYRSSEVYARKFGDCKDKATLLKVMLKMIGVDSFLSLVRTVDLGKIGRSPASLAAFNHAVLYLPKYNTFLDATVEYSSMKPLPTILQGAETLIVKDGEGAIWTEIPVEKSEHNFSREYEHLIMDSSGAASLEYSLEVGGWQSAPLRRSLSDIEVPLLTSIPSLSKRYPAFELIESTIKNVEKWQQPVQVSLRGDVPDFAEKIGSGWRFAIWGGRSNQYSELAPSRLRTVALLLPRRGHESGRKIIELPPKMKWKTIPSNVDFRSEFGRFHLDVQKDDASIRIEYRIELDTVRVEATKANSFRKFVKKIDAGLSQWFEYEPLVE